MFGHSPADPEHERGRKEEKQWVKQYADPLKIFRSLVTDKNWMTVENLDEIDKRVTAEVSYDTCK